LTKYRNILNKTIILAEKKHFASLFAEISNNAKKTWQVINTILSTARSDTKIKTFTDENGRAFDDLESATNFNSYFAKIGADLASKISNTTS